LVEGRRKTQGEQCPGQHKAVISQELWDTTSKTFEENRHERMQERVRVYEDAFFADAVRFGAPEVAFDAAQLQRFAREDEAAPTT
jgi:hypothetical protein